MNVKRYNDPLRLCRIPPEELYDFLSSRDAEEKAIVLKFQIYDNLAKEALLKIKIGYMNPNYPDQMSAWVEQFRFLHEKADFFDRAVRTMNFCKSLEYRNTYDNLLVFFAVFGQFEEILSLTPYEEIAKHALGELNEIWKLEEPEKTEQLWNWYNKHLEDSQYMVDMGMSYFFFGNEYSPVLNHHLGLISSGLKGGVYFVADHLRNLSRFFSKFFDVKIYLKIE